MKKEMSNNSEITGVVLGIIGLAFGLFANGAAAIALGITGLIFSTRANKAAKTPWSKRGILINIICIVVGVIVIVASIIIWNNLQGSTALLDQLQP